MWQVQGKLSNRVYAEGKFKAEVLRQLTLDYPSLKYTMHKNGTVSNQAQIPVLPEAMQLVEVQ